MYVLLPHTSRRRPTLEALPALSTCNRTDRRSLSLHAFVFVLYFESVFFFLENPFQSLFTPLYYVGRSWAISPSRALDHLKFPSFSHLNRGPRADTLLGFL